MEMSDFNTPEKEFCALKMKEVIQAKIYEEIKDMTFAELRARYDKNLENDAFWQKLVKRDKNKQENQ
jgi:hypothetical protein